MQRVAALAHRAAQVDRGLAGTASDGLARLRQPQRDLALGVLGGALTLFFFLPVSLQDTLILRAPDPDLAGGDAARDLARTRRRGAGGRCGERRGGDVEGRLAVVTELST